MIAGQKSSTLTSGSRSIKLFSPNKVPWRIYCWEYMETIPTTSGVVPPATSVCSLVQYSPQGVFSHLTPLFQQTHRPKPKTCDVTLVLSTSGFLLFLACSSLVRNDRYHSWQN